MKIYPTDDEILSMIEELEKEPLFAPQHLKDEILDKLAQDIRPSVPTKQISVFVYNMKIIVGVAAALLLTFTLPHALETLNLQEQIYEYQVEAAKDKYENQDLEAESRLNKIFRISTTAMNDTADVFLDSINIFENLNN